jgi:hypothetical protein
MRINGVMDVGSTIRNACTSAIEHKQRTKFCACVILDCSDSDTTEQQQR